jgi:hypothetical protein
MSKPIYEIIKDNIVIFSGTSGEIAKHFNVTRLSIRKSAATISKNFISEYKINKTTSVKENNTKKVIRVKKVITSTVMPKRRNKEPEKRRAIVEETSGLIDKTFNETIINKQGYVVTNTYFKRKNEVFLYKTYAHGHKDNFSHLIKK